MRSASARARRLTLPSGLGAVGALYSYALERSGKARVTAVARSNAAIVRERGITVDSAKHGALRYVHLSSALRSQTLRPGFVG